MPPSLPKPESFTPPNGVSAPLMAKVLIPTMFRKTARNFNLPAATCGKVCVVEVEQMVPVGSLDPDCIHLPGVYVQRMIVGAPYDKKIEFTTTRERETACPSWWQPPLCSHRER